MNEWMNEWFTYMRFIVYWFTPEALHSHVCVCVCVCVGGGGGSLLNHHQTKEKNNIKSSLT